MYCIILVGDVTELKLKRAHDVKGQLFVSQNITTCSAFYLLHNEFNKFNNTGARMLDSIYHMTFIIILKSYFGMKTLGICYMRDVKSAIS